MSIMKEIEIMQDALNVLKDHADKIEEHERVLIDIESKLDKRITKEELIDYILTEYSEKNCLPYSDISNGLYAEFERRHNIDIQKLSRTVNKSMLDLIDGIGMFEELYDIAIELDTEYQDERN